MSGCRFGPVCFTLNFQEEARGSQTLLKLSASALTHYREIHLEPPQCSPPHSDGFFDALKLQKQAAILQSNYTLERERERERKQGGFSALITNRLINNTPAKKNTSDGEGGFLHRRDFSSFFFSVFHVEYVMTDLRDRREFNGYLQMTVTRVMCLHVRSFIKGC